MKTSEQILDEIKLAIASNNESKKKSNIALNDAIQLVLHAEKEINIRLNEEYKRGMNDAWESVRELFNMDSNEYTEVFCDASIKRVVETCHPQIIKEKITLHREEKKNNICVGDVVQDSNDDTKATILDHDHDINLMGEGYWMVFTENGCVESWCENEFTKTGESVDVCGALIK